MPSELEIQNAGVVLNMLSSIGGLSFDQVREDIFKVTEFDTGMDLSIVVDVEETSVINLLEVCNVPEGADLVSLYKMLLEANNKSVHGAFAITPEGKIIIKDVLEIQNLNKNELEASLAYVFELAAKNIDKIAEAVQ